MVPVSFWLWAEGILAAACISLSMCCLQLCQNFEFLWLSLLFSVISERKLCFWISQKVTRFSILITCSKSFQSWIYISAWLNNLEMRILGEEGSHLQNSTNRRNLLHSIHYGRCGWVRKGHYFWDPRKSWDKSVKSTVLPTKWIFQIIM